MRFTFHFVVSTLLIATNCVAQEIEKNGLPCAGEVCIGDGIAELGKVQWDKATNPFSRPEKPFYTAKRSVSESDFRMLRDQYKGDISKAAPYLADKQFDGEALPALARVRAACTPGELEGSYTTKAGNRTRVSIALGPSRDSTSEQQWTVVKIYRLIPTPVSTQQRARAQAELNQRYKRYAYSSAGNPKPGEARFKMGMGMGSPFGFQLFQFLGNELGNRLKLHPLCGGPARVKID